VHNTILAELSRGSSAAREAVRGALVKLVAELSFTLS
jgi:hypothetical protein